MYLLKFEDDDDLANIKVGDSASLYQWISSNKGLFTCRFYGNVTYIQQDGEDIGMIVKVEEINIK
jgi:hypothetical protein